MSRSPSHWRYLAAFTLALAGVAASATAALAHASLVRSDPIDGASLVSAPHEILLVFTEPVVADLVSVELVDDTGRRFPAAVINPVDSEALRIRLPPLADGVYRFSWDTVSSDDLHEASGSIVFGIGRVPEAARAAVGQSSPFQPMVGLLRVINLLALTGLIGAVAVAGMTHWSGRSSRHQAAALLAQRLEARLLVMALLATAIAILAGPAALTTQALAAAPLGLLAPDLRWLPGQIAVAAILRAGALALLLAILLVRLGRARASPSRARTSTDAAVVVLLCVVVLLEVTTTHAASGEPRALGILVAAIHLLSAATWAGGLAAMAVSVLPAARRSAVGRLLAPAILLRFSWLAALAVVASAASGLALASRLIASADALLFTSYGEVLVVKVVLAGGAALIGLANAATLHRWGTGILRLSSLSPGQRLRLVALEAGTAAAVIGLAAVLSTLPPANGPEFRALSADAPPPPFGGRADDLLVTASLRPGREGLNFVTLGVHDTRRPAPATIERVIVRVARADGSRDAWVTATAIRTDDGGFEVAGLDLPSAGSWRMEIEVERPGMPAARASTTWPVAPPAPSVARRPTIVSDAPLGPILAVFALLAGGGGAGVVGVIARRTSPRRPRVRRSIATIDGGRLPDAVRVPVR
jgi:copper transport protein